VWTKKWNYAIIHLESSRIFYIKNRGGTMRDKLSGFAHAGSRNTFSGIFMHYGIKQTNDGPRKTILLKSIKREGKKKIYTDHVWLDVSAEIKALHLKEGDIVSFSALVDNYLKKQRKVIDDELSVTSLRKDYKFYKIRDWQKVRHIDLSTGKVTKVKETIL
jgi:hypothetical protein